MYLIPRQADKREANGKESEVRDKACVSQRPQRRRKQRVHLRMRQDQSAPAAPQTDVSLFCKNQQVMK